MLQLHLLSQTNLELEGQGYRHNSGPAKSTLINNAILGGCFKSRQTLWNYSFGSGGNMQTCRPDGSCRLLISNVRPPGVWRQKSEAGSQRKGGRGWGGVAV